MEVVRASLGRKNEPSVCELSANNTVLRLKHLDAADVDRELRPIAAGLALPFGPDKRVPSPTVTTSRQSTAEKTLLTRPIGRVLQTSTKNKAWNIEEAMIRFPALQNLLQQEYASRMSRAAVGL